MQVRQTTQDRSIYHKNLKPVVYVTGDVAGAQESPVYAILKMNRAISQMKTPFGYEVQHYTTAAPFDTTKYAMKWDGEWHITYEVFRDMGAAFAAVLVLIYILVVAWFKSFKTPLVIMAPIPLTLVGILPAHALLGAFFTATSMIGFIAGAGIIVQKLDHPGGLHRAATEAGNAARGGGGRCWGGAIPADAADGGGGHGGRVGDPDGPDLPGAGDLADGGGGGIDAALENGGAGALLHEREREAVIGIAETLRGNEALKLTSAPQLSVQFRQRGGHSRVTRSNCNASVWLPGRMRLRTSPSVGLSPRR